MRRNRLGIAAIALVLPMIAMADEPAPPALPETPEPPALRYARHDVQKWKELAQPLRKNADAAGVKAKQAEQTLAAAKNEQAKAAAALNKTEQQVKSATADRDGAKKRQKEAEETLSRATKQIESADGSRAEAEKAVPLKKQAFREAVEAAGQVVETFDAQPAKEKEKQTSAELKSAAVSAAKTLQKAADELAAAIDAVAEAKTAKAAAVKEAEQARASIKKLQEQLAEHEQKLAKLTEAKNAALAAKAAADKKVAQAAAALKPLAEAKTAAEKKASAAEAKVAAAASVLARYQKEPPRALPKSIREIRKITHNRPVISCRFGEYGNYLFAGAQDRSLHRWDLFTGERTDLQGHRSWIRRFAFHPDGARLLSGAYGGKLIWWNAFEESPAPLRDVDAHEGFCRAVAVSPDGQLVASGGNDGVIRIWSAETGEPIAEIPGHERHVYNVAFHPYENFLVSGDLMGNVKQWEVGTWNHVRDFDAGVLSKYDKSFRADCGGIRGMDFSPDGRFLVVSGISEVSNAFAGVGVPTAVLFDFESGRRLSVMKPAKKFRGACWGVRFHPSGEFIIGAGGGSGGSLWFWKPGEEKSFFDHKLPNVAYDVAVHPDGLRIAVALYDKTVRVYSLGPKE